MLLKDEDGIDVDLMCDHTTFIREFEKKVARMEDTQVNV